MPVWLRFNQCRYWRPTHSDHCSLGTDHSALITRHCSLLTAHSALSPKPVTKNDGVLLKILEN